MTMQFPSSIFVFALLAYYVEIEFLDYKVQIQQTGMITDVVQSSNESCEKCI